MASATAKIGASVDSEPSDQTSHRWLHALKQERLFNALSGWIYQVCRGHMDLSSVMN